MIPEEKCKSCRGFGYTKGGPAGPWEKLDCEPCKGSGYVFYPLSPKEQLLSWDEFVDDVRNGVLTDLDGWGHLATESEMSTEVIVPSDLKTGTVRPRWATFVVWFSL